MENRNTPGLAARYGVGLLRISLLFAGFSSVLAISLSVFEWLTLKQGGLLLVVPALVYIFFVLLGFPVFRRLVLRGWLTGILAVLCYDLSRIPFVLAGWEDFIPRIASSFSDKEEMQLIIAYAWRYAGNGGGMGISFLMLLHYSNHRMSVPLLGIVFGVAVFACLLATLVLSAKGQEYMFPLNLLSFCGSLTGHLVYGLVLGLLARRWKIPHPANGTMKPLLLS